MILDVLHLTFFPPICLSADLTSLCCVDVSSTSLDALNYKRSSNFVPRLQEKGGPIGATDPDFYLVRVSGAFASSSSPCFSHGDPSPPPPPFSFVVLYRLTWGAKREASGRNGSQLMVLLAGRRRRRMDEWIMLLSRLPFVL